MEILGKGMILIEAEEELLNEQYGPWMRALNPRTPLRRTGEETTAGNITSHGGGIGHQTGNDERGWARCGGDIFSASSMMHSGTRNLGDEDPRDTIAAEKRGPCAEWRTT
ncbi:hypothetical protein Salat_1614600 [Sesamum alatum]|uniref:Uncharacterized protein n=1 Tax=Sesamum alatum TaxID=300844 RepID=A0AAE1Y6G0_9LAMI|nr:hypothetical protein Salat_1614600 [Sesamum alatum]